MRTSERAVLTLEVPQDEIVVLKVVSFSIGPVDYHIALVIT